MFTNPGTKLKTFALTVFFIEAIVGLVISIAILGGLGIFVAIFFVIVAWINTILMYTVGDMWEITAKSYNEMKNASIKKFTPLEQAKVSSTGPVVSHKTGSEWKCPKCGKTNPTSSRVCKDCGYNN